MLLKLVFRKITLQHKESKKEGISTESFVVPKIKWDSERHAGIFIVSRHEPANKIKKTYK